jgi:hypothetical protein
LLRLAAHHYRTGAYYRAISAYEELALFADDDATRRYAAFYGLAALAVVFYAGSAVQGYVSVARHNAVRELEARQSVWRDTDVALPLEAMNRL